MAGHKLGIILVVLTASANFCSGQLMNYFKWATAALDEGSEASTQLKRDYPQNLFSLSHSLRGHNLVKEVHKSHTTHIFHTCISCKITHVRTLKSTYVRSWCVNLF